MSIDGIKKCLICKKKRDKSYFRFISFISSKSVCYDCERDRDSIIKSVDVVKPQLKEREAT